MAFTAERGGSPVVADARLHSIFYFSFDTSAYSEKLIRTAILATRSLRSCQPPPPHHTASN